MGLLRRWFFFFCASFGVWGIALPAHASSLKEVIETLKRSPHGMELLVKAASQKVRVSWGDVSRTDAVLSREFDPAQGGEVRTREVTVYLRKDQPFQDQVLDLSHELIHATTDPGWDPYDADLTRLRYIHAIIDGPGGEVDAMMSECQTAFELSEVMGWDPGRCRKYRGANGKIRRELLVRDFYAVGENLAAIQKALSPAEREQLHELHGGEPVFFSSTGRAPYPLSLIREFGEITQVACQNSIERIQTLAAAQSAEKTDSRYQAVQEAKVFIFKRCANPDTFSGIH